MWTIEKKQVPHDWLDFEPETVLDEYDGPILFTLRDVAGNKYLAYFCGRGGEGVRFLVVSFSDELQAKLLAGDIDMRETLTRQPMWLFDLDKKWEPAGCWQVVPEDLPHDLLPKSGVMLYP